MGNFMLKKRLSDEEEMLNLEVIRTISGSKTIDRLQATVVFLYACVKERLTGSIEIHFNQGGICKTIKHRIIK